MANSDYKPMSIMGNEEEMHISTPFSHISIINTIAVSNLKNVPIIKCSKIVRKSWVLSIYYLLSIIYLIVYGIKFFNMVVLTDWHARFLNMWNHGKCESKLENEQLRGGPSMPLLKAKYNKKFICT